MEIIKAEHAGFCFGVSNAVKKAYETAEQYDGKKKVFCLGKIIHNDVVVKSLEEKGVITVDSPEETEDGSVAIIRAHGVSPEVIGILKKKNCTVVDATCPFVENIHEKVRQKFDEGYSIIIFGDSSHPEVVGINGMCNNSGVIVSSEDDINRKILPCISRGKSICVVAQTTFNRKKFEDLCKIIKKFFDNAVIFDTICFATSIRQKETEKIAETVDLMIVVGGRESSNTRKLYEISKEKCKNVISVESASDLQLCNIVKKCKVGVTAGASTPERVIEEVIVTMENSMENSENFESMLEESLKTLTNGDVVKGAITKVDAKGVYIDLGFKYEGFIAIDEFKAYPDQEAPILNEGDEVEAVVVKVSDKDCEVVLSKRRVDYKKEMQVLEDSFENKTTIEVTVTEEVKGGVIARYGSSRVFIPASQLDERFVRDISSFVGKKLEVVITSFEKGPKGKLRVVASRKVIVDEVKKAASEAFWADASEGQIRKGIVKNFAPFGAFIDLGGIDGLIPLSELSWKRIRRPQDVLSIGQEVEVKIVSLDREKSRISLGYRKEEDNPWFDAENLYQVGDILEVTVVRFASFGVFVNIAKGIDGLVHISQISNKRITSADQCLTIGQKVQAKIIETNIADQKISLSIKEVKPYDPEPTPEDLEREAEREEKKAKKAKKKAEKSEEEEYENTNTSTATSIGDILAAKEQN